MGIASRSPTPGSSVTQREINGWVDYLRTHILENATTARHLLALLQQAAFAGLDKPSEKPRSFMGGRLRKEARKWSGTACRTEEQFNLKDLLGEAATRIEQLEARITRSAIGTHWVFAAAEACRPAVHGMDAGSGIKYETREHLFYMLDQIRDGGFSPTKACRWLGWVQACLYCNGTLSLEDSKEINRRASDRSASNG